MFEHKTFNNILNDVMSRITSELDKREGAIIYDAIAPTCAELAQLYIDMDTVLNQTFGDTATGNYLEERTKERGITREPATYAIVQGEFVPADLDLVGKRFNCGEYNYRVIEDNKLQCETAGSAPNAITGQLIPIEYINGLEKASIVSVLKPAEDAESDEHLRQRYFISLRDQAYGGNIADYQQKTNSIEGVGGVKVTPTWNGGGTVKLTIIASDYSVPTQYLIDTVQNAIDPTNDYSGVGIAPIGHVVTVEPVSAVNIDVHTNITYADGWSFETAKEYIYAALDEYFLELRKAWEQSQSTVIRISHIETRLLACDGIIDVGDTTINGSYDNLQLDKYSVPLRGDFNA